MLPSNVTDIKTAADADFARDRADAEAFRRIGQAGWVLVREIEQAEPLDWFKCPRCGIDATVKDGPGSILNLVLIERRYCCDCHLHYRVEFRAVRVEAE